MQEFIDVLLERITPYILPCILFIVFIAVIAIIINYAVYKIKSKFM